MHVVVVGAGVIGMTTACFLARRGLDVTVIDGRAEAAAATSHANGGQLSYSFSDALGRPSYIARLPSLLLGRAKGARIRLSPGLVPWGLRFLRQCTRQRADTNTLDTFRRALRSAELMEALLDDIDFDFSHRRAGKMILLDSNEALQAARRGIELKAGLGCDNVLLDARESIEREPAIEAFRNKPLASIYSPGDQVGDARAFAIGLRRWLESNFGLRCRFGEAVSRLVRERGRVRRVVTDAADYAADAVVVCAGAWSNALLKPLGHSLPIYPMRGYSLTLPAGTDAPSVSLTALSQQFVFSRLGEHMRIAGFGDFVGFDDSGDARRIGDLFEVARQLAPYAADYEAAERRAWGGYRPMTPDSLPRVGSTGIDGLYTNAGHGMLGWTLACESGERVAHAVKETA